MWWKNAIFALGFISRIMPRAEPQVVVVDPDQRVVLGLLARRFGEAAVHVAEGLPVDGVVLEVLREGVEDRPQSLFRGGTW